MASRSVQASVIIPVFNAAAHIEEQLLALAGQQTDVSWELIVADNGCTDETLAIVELLSPLINAPVRVVDASVRRGTGAARNAGSAAAAGELLLFTDQDDVVDQLWVQEMAGALRTHPFVAGRREILELNGEQVASWRAPTAEQALPRLRGRPYAVGNNCGCTAAAFAAVGGFDESFMRGGEDVDFSFRMDARGMTAVFAERAIVHYRYRQDPGQTVRQLWGYGRSTAPVYRLHGIDPPSLLDVVITCHRLVKQAVRDALSGRRPVRQVVDMAYVIGEASTLWRDPAFWRPVARRGLVANPLVVQGQRARRLGRFLIGGFRARRG